MPIRNVNRTVGTIISNYVTKSTARQVAGWHNRVGIQRLGRPKFRAF